MENAINLALSRMGYTLRFYRRLRGMSQMELAQTAGLSFRNYQRLENGEVVPRADTLLMLSQTLGISLASIIEPPNQHWLGISEELNSSEKEIFLSLEKFASQKPAVFLAQEIVFQDQALRSEEFFSFTMTGNKAEIGPQFQHYLKIDSPFLNIDDYLQGIKAVDFWECVNRNQTTQIKVTNLLKFPIGLRFFESYHRILSCNPENPRSIGFTRDCTARCELQNWIQGNKAPLPKMKISSQLESLTSEN